MSNWFDKYLSIYGQPFSEVPQEVIDGTRERLAALQSNHPIASIVVIAYNEETHLQACLWAISEMKCKYTVFIGQFQILEHFFCLTYHPNDSNT